MERALFSKYLELMEHLEGSLAHELMSDSDGTVENCRRVTENVAFEDLMKRYEVFFHDTINGKYGGIASYWATYVYFINRVYR